MAKRLWNVVILCVLFANSQCTNANTCTRQNSCLCSLNEFQKIDISNIIPKENDKFLSDFDRKSNLTYFFHGCENAQFNPQSYNINSTKNYTTSMLVYNETSKEITDLGNSTIMDFHAAADNPEAFEIVYKNGNEVTASIRLICDNFNKSLIKILNPAENQLALLSPEVCVITHHPGLSNGSVLLILFLISVMVYLICGGIILYCFRGARGIELIPNIDFWRKIPGLVKDGVIFLVNGCNASSISTSETYDRI